MNYLEWSQEYSATAERLADTIHKLQRRRKSASLGEKKDIDERIAQYRACRYECLSVANHLMLRHRGVA